MTELFLNPDTQLVTTTDPDPTVSVLWDRAVQQAVIETEVGPTVASRAYAMVHTAIYDAWASYDPVAVPTYSDRQVAEPEITEANKTEAMSHAAYKVAMDLFPEQAEIFAEVMSQLGYEVENPSLAASVGNSVAAALLSFRHNDNSNQLDNYSSELYEYIAVNSTEEITDLGYWTPEYVPVDDPNGSIQSFLTPHWGEVTPFALDNGSLFRPAPPEPFLLVSGEVDLVQQTITLENGEELEIDRDLIGTVINPEFIAQAEAIVETSANLTDEQKLIAEFWEDGGGTSFPPGTWMTFGQYVSARDDHSIDDDAKLFFSLGNAVMDAGIATWEAKTYYDYARPVRAIRELGRLGLIGGYDADLEGYAVEAWTPSGDTQTILATDFLTYQTPGGHVSPPFAEYTSGHSAFSAAGAEILRLFTGSDDFGGSVTFQPGESRFEPEATPSEATTLEWDTFSTAADEAGLSRIYGGIHFEDGDINGRTLGRQVGTVAFAEANSYINGTISPSDLNLDRPIYRLQHQVTRGAYMFVGEAELNQIEDEYPDLVSEGMAFKVSETESAGLMAMYRFQNQVNPECYVLVGEEERNAILEDSDLSNAFSEQGIAFYVLEADSNSGENIYRFRSVEMTGNYIYVTESERQTILNDHSNTFIEEGMAFAAEI